MASLTRRLALLVLPVLALAACGQADGGSAKATPAEAAVRAELGHVKGDPNAPVTLIEYASPTCGACKFWHDTVQPVIQEKYIDTGKVKLVFREFPLNQIDIAAYSMARCAGPENYFAVINDLFENQRGIIQAAQNSVAKTALLTIGQKYGIKDAQALDACLTDQAIRNALADVYASAEQYGVNGTPTFVLDGKVRNFEGDYQTAEGFSKQIDAILAEKGIR
ncbi:MAG: thioredoxin domain-containing protein [Hyphomonas sp.]